MALFMHSTAGLGFSRGVVVLCSFWTGAIAPDPPPLPQRRLPSRSLATAQRYRTLNATASQRFSSSTRPAASLATATARHRPTGSGRRSRSVKLERRPALARRRTDVTNNGELQLRGRVSLPFACRNWQRVCLALDTLTRTRSIGAPPQERSVA